MTPHSERLEAARRQAILVALFLAPGYRLPERQLRESVEATGHAASMDRLRTDCAWLTEQGLVETAVGALALTERGADVVQSRVDVPGVRRAEPGELDVLRQALVSAGLAAARATLGI